MIIGIGVDLIDARRIENTLTEHGERFINRLFLKSEQDFVAARKNSYSGKHNLIFFQATEYAKIYAAKEALVKALGTGFQKGISWQDIEIQRLSSGQPIINLLSSAQQRLVELADAGDINIHLSLTDEIPYVQAFVIIDKFIT